jgi:6-phosphogluconate dehydrogenase
VKLGFIGLGKMGKGMVLRLLEKGHKLVVYNRSPEPVEEMRSFGAEAIKDFSELGEKLPPPRLVWIMLPSQVIDKIVFGDSGLASYLDSGDTLVDGGNSFFRDSIVRSQKLAAKGINFLDAGCSGGPKGARNGLSIMIGGSKSVYQELEPLFRDLSVADGYQHVGSTGAGHFVKMVHNAIEYGILQSIAEGFDLLENGPYKDLNLHQIAELWNHGSVIRSFLMELAAKALEKDPHLGEIAGFVEDTGEGRWSVEEAIASNIPFTTITHSLYARFRSRRDDSFADKLIAALRYQFGSHKVKKK